jgi:hypothetical protein
MQRLLIVFGILMTATIGFTATSPFIPEVENRFVAIESTNTTQGTDIDAAEAAIVVTQGTHKIKTVTATYDFAVDGGDVGAISSSLTIPDNAVIVGCYIDILTAMSSTGNNGTMAVHLQSANDILSAVDGDTLSGIVACVPTGTAASSFKLTAARVLTFTIATNAMLSGKFVVVIRYAVTE